MKNVVAEFADTAIVLMYHRVAQVGPDPFSLCVTPEHFGEHLEFLQTHARPTRLQHLTEDLRKQIIRPRSVVLTFDDGYADNLQNARPLLKRYGVPATVFIVTGNLGEEREFWWDELERLFLEPGTLPDRLCLNVQGNMHRWELGETAHYSEEACRRHRNWRAGEEKSPTERHSLYSSVWRLLQLLPETERRSVLNELVSWAGGSSKSRPPYRSLSYREVLSLAEGDFIEVGAHTVNHPALCELPVELQRNEIQQSKVWLEEILNRPVVSFSYPYGARSDETVAIVRDTGFDCACSTVIGQVHRDADPYQLPRVQVEDWDGDEFGKRLTAWFCGSNVL